MKPKNIYIATPQDKGVVVDFMENEKPKKIACSSAKDAWQSIKNKIPATHQFMVTDMGEVSKAVNDGY